MSNLINAHTHTHVHSSKNFSSIERVPPSSRLIIFFGEWHRMTRMTGPDCAVMCNLRNKHTYTHTQTGVEANKGAQDGNGDGSGDGSGDGAGTGVGTGVGIRRRTPDGNGDGNGDVSEDCSGDGDGDEDNGNENRIGEGGRGTKKRKKPQNSCRRRAGNGGDMGGKRKKCRKERVGSVAANSDNLGSNKEAGGGAQGAQGSSQICTSRESVSPLSRLIRGFRNKYH